MSFKSIYPSASTRPHMQDRSDGKPFGLTNLLQSVPVINYVLIGAILQGLAFYLFSSGRYLLLICTVVLLARIVNVCLQAYGITNNPYLEGVIPGRTTALVPDENTGEITTAGNKKIVVLHLGAKSNHPFGYLAPQFGTVGDWMTKMMREMDRGESKGFLGQTTFQRRDIRGAPEVNLISYWESIEDLWAFAHSGTHREAWQWWEKTIKSNGYVGINHEIFEADAKHWENVYVNFQPTMMGATTFLKKGGKNFEGGVVPDEWVSPLVDARKGKLAKSSGRMGREISIYDDNRIAKDTYDA